MPAMLRRLGDLLLTDDPVQRLRLSQAGLAMLLMTVSVIAMHAVAQAGNAPRQPVTWWTAVSLGGLLAFYVTIRSGASRRFADPSLTLPQMVYAIACAAAAYAMAGPARGGVFPVLLVILTFGLFQLSPMRVAWISLYAVGVFGGVMAVMSALEPARYPADIEGAHFLMIATMLPAMSLLAGRLSSMRERARRQKRDLAAALARIQELATHDELTGLINRRHMQELLEQERQRCVRSGQTFCIAMIDVDGLRQVIDRAGHAGADELLRSVAQLGLSAIRAADVLGRWGGDRYVLMLTGSHAGLARVALERLRERIALADTEIDGASYRVTVSAGLTQHIAGEPVDEAVLRAQRALADAKAQGRNRVVVA